MRTSSKILIAACCLVVINLVVYDLGLKAAYQKGDYTNPYSDFEQLNYHHFDEIELNASTTVSIIVVQGPYKILVNPSAQDYLRVTERDRRLVISAAFHDHYQGSPADYLVYISCPDLRLLKTDAWYSVGETRITDTTVRDLTWKPSLLKGFTLDSLDLQEDNASNLVLANNRIKTLTGTIGLGLNSGPALTIATDNLFGKSDVNMQNKSRLVIKGTEPSNLTYHLADSATLVISGAAAKHLLNIKQQ